MSTKQIAISASVRIPKGTCAKLVKLSEPCHCDALTKVFALYLDLDAHLLQATSHPFANAIAKCLLPESATNRRNLQAAAQWSYVCVVCRDDGRSAVVIASVKNQAYGVPDPFAWFCCSQFVQDQHFGLKDRLKDRKLGGLDLLVVTVLNLLQEFAIVAEEPCRSAFRDKLSQNARCEMCLADAQSNLSEAARGRRCRPDISRRSRSRDGERRRWFSSLRGSRSHNFQACNAHIGVGSWLPRRDGLHVVEDDSCNPA